MDRRRTISSPPSLDSYFIDIIEFDHTPLWKDKSFLTQKYVTERRSIAQIAEETHSSRPTIRKALIGFGTKLRQRGKPGLRPAQVPYGYRIVDGLMVHTKANKKFCR